MTSPWIDFKELRSKLRFADVLQHHGVTLKVKGEKATGFCPLPSHPRHEGKHHSPSFSANLSRGIFQCFGCGAKGNVLDFAIRMQSLDPSNPQHVRQVAVNLSERVSLTKTAVVTVRAASEVTAALSPSVPAEELSGPAQKNAERAVTRPALVNVPLDFELKHLDPRHPYLKERGFTDETIAHFGLGYCSRGLMQGRIAIPLHDVEGRLIGYAGRLVDDTKITDDDPKYRFPGDREHQRQTLEFRKSMFLYNGHRISEPVEDLIVVEGFASVWWLWQNGYPDVVAVMGSSCHPAQAETLAGMVSGSGRVWALTDGDEAGRRLAQNILAAVSPQRSCRWAKLAPGLQPTGLDREQIRLLLQTI